MGYPIPNPIVLSEHDNSLNFKKDHKFFNTDVISYNTGKSTKVEVFL